MAPKVGLNGGYQLDIIKGSDEVGKVLEDTWMLILTYKDQEKQKSSISSFNYKKVYVVQFVLEVQV